MFKKPVLLEPVLALGIIEETEAPRIVEAQHGAVLECDYDVVVAAIFVGTGAAEDHAAGHTKMCEQHAAALDMKEQVLGASPDAFDAAPFKPRGETGRQGKAQIGAIQDHADDALAGDLRGQTPRDRLDLGKLGHER